MKLPIAYAKVTRGKFLASHRRFMALVGAVFVAFLLVASVGRGAESQTSECFPIPAHRTNDTNAIASAIENHRCARFKANTTYWIDGRVIKVPAGRTILGAPGNSIKLRSYGPNNNKCQMVSPHGHAKTRHRHCAAYFLWNNTNASDIVIDGLNIDGRRGDLRYGTKYHGGTAISFKRLDGERSEGVRIRNTKISNWPGVSIYSSAFRNLVLKNVRSRNPGRGGIVISAAMQDRDGRRAHTISTGVRFIGVSSTGSGDDALAMMGVKGFLVRNSVGSTRATGPVETPTGAIGLHGAGLALRNVQGANTKPNVVGFETSDSHNAGVLVARYPKYPGPHPKNIFITDSYIVGSGFNGIKVEVGSPYSENIRIESNRRIVGARKTAAVQFKNLPGSNKVNVAPSTYQNNANLDTPELACNGVTGITGNNGRC
jgi:hypothetical protein